MHARLAFKEKKTQTQTGLGIKAAAALAASVQVGGWQLSMTTHALSEHRKSEFNNFLAIKIN